METPDNKGAGIKSYLKYEKVGLVNRVSAKIIDIVIILALAIILPRFIGPLLGFLYSLLADSLNVGPFHSQSIGKKIFGLQVINIEKRELAGIKDSVMRNIPVGVATFFAIIPIWGWVLLFLVGVPLMIMEIYLIARVDSGHRLGDVMADTQVIEVEGGLSSSLSELEKNSKKKKEAKESHEQSSKDVQSKQSRQATVESQKEPSDGSNEERA